MHSLKNLFIFGFMMWMYVFVCVCLYLVLFSTRSLIFNEQYHHQVYVLNVTTTFTRLWCITLLCELYISYCVCLQLYCVSVLFYLLFILYVCVRRSFFSKKKTVSYLFIMGFIINRTSEYGLSQTKTSAW